MINLPPVEHKLMSLTKIVITAKGKLSRLRQQLLGCLILVKIVCMTCVLLVFLKSFPEIVHILAGIVSCFILNVLVGCQSESDKGFVVTAFRCKVFCT